MAGQFKQSLGIIESIWSHPANRGKRLHAVMRFFRWQFVKRAIGQPVVVDFHGKKLNCYPDSTSSSSVIYFNGLPDYWEMKFIQAYLRPGDSFLDVGANVGVYTMLAASCVGETGSVDAFEPIEATARRIEEQVALNKLGNVEVHRLAVGAENETVDFGFASNSAMMHLKRGDEAGAGALHVQGIRLDDFKPDKHYAMGKMDIEGAEPLALRGASNRLGNANPPVWLLELAGYSQFYGMSSDEVIGFLKSNGYRCGIYDAAHKNIIFTDQPWLLGVQNILAIAEQYKDLVMSKITAAGTA
jgi:FkbM family methyltransferase